MCYTVFGVHHSNHENNVSLDVREILDREKSTHYCWDWNIDEVEIVRVCVYRGSQFQLYSFATMAIVESKAESLAML